MSTAGPGAGSPAIIRAACESDLPTVRALFEEYAGTLGFELDFQDFEEELATLPGAYAPPGGALLIAEVEGEAAGCIGLRSLGEGCCELKRMYVRPAYRRRGIGRTLAEEIIRMARDRGYARMRLDTIDTMTTAIALYESLGFAGIPAYRPNPIAGAAFFELDLRTPGRP